MPIPESIAIATHGSALYLIQLVRSGLQRITSA
jgi:hypothetical protein